MPANRAAQRRFQATLEGTEKGRVYVRLPFDPAEAWGPRERYHITGSINGHPVRGPVETSGSGALLSLGPVYRRDNGLRAGDTVSVLLNVEGPQRDALAPDIASALADDPAAALAFDALATFYRKGCLRWIDATKRRPDVRAARIAEMVEFLKAGRKQPPR